MYEKITILQISDLHAGVGIASPGLSKNDLLSTLYGRLHSILPKLKEQHETFDLVVFNGDFVDSGNTDKFLDVLNDFIVPLKSELSAAIVIAVPGNHDINRRELRRIRGLKHFKGAFSAYAYNPMHADGPVFPSRKGTAQIWPVNSVHLAGIPDPDWIPFIIDPAKLKKVNINTAKLKDVIIDAAKIKDSDSKPWKIDPAYVNPDDMGACSIALKKNTFRIAVIHHNPIPCPGEGSKNGKMKKYRFVNDGDFNRFLVQNNFRLVLHGHQHVSRISYYSPYSDWLEAYSKKKEQLSHLDCGFLTVGASTFGGSKELGFNVIKLEISDPSRIVMATVYQYSVEYNRLKESKLTFLLPHRPIRKDISELLYHITYKMCSSAEGWKRVKELHRAKKEKMHFEHIRRKRTKITDIRGVYSVSVFAPKLWGTENLADLFLPIGKRNIARAVAVAKKNEFHLQGDKPLRKALGNRLKEGRPSLYFSFSDPLSDAIENALSISKKLKVTTRLRNRFKNEKFRNAIELPQLDFLQRCFGPSKKNAKDVFNSLSIWDNTETIYNADIRHRIEHQPDEGELDEIVRNMLELPNIGEMRITISRLGGTPKFNFGKTGSARRLVESLFESPRILIWDDASFGEPEALQCVEFHEECAMPLFWLRPSRLNTRGAANTKPREKIGHVTFFGLRDSRGRLLSEAETLWNNDVGEEPTPPPDIWAGGRLEWIWRTREGYPACLDPNGKLVEEFMYLLKRPDIMFAADAWAMRLLGDKTWNELISLLETIDCSAWLNEKQA